MTAADDRYKHVDAAMAVIQASGLRCEVHALGTVVEGPPVWTTWCASCVSDPL
ncbi:MAG: thiamine-binding protein [Roseateles sp.]|uniref:thiamine-binding protein n=1 Tax=Roseateles sp. TaxID=1971397 RepID=UPI00403644A0